MTDKTMDDPLSDKRLEMAAETIDALAAKMGDGFGLDMCQFEIIRQKNYGSTWAINLWQGEEPLHVVGAPTILKAVKKLAAKNYAGEEN
jgi:hypothetical protein